MRRIVIAVCLVVLAAGTAHAECKATDDASHFICRFGMPDKDDSTAYDKPRPPIPTRILTYRKEKVSAIYVADSKLGAPPPYKWKLIGFTDPTKDSKLDPSEAVKRLSARDQQKK
jgi:hypothetical protein